MAADYAYTTRLQKNDTIEIFIYNNFHLGNCRKNQFSITKSIYSTY